MLQTISRLLNISFLSTKANKNQYNQEVKSIGNVGGIVKTLSKAKKSKTLAKSQKPKLAKIINKAFGTDFLIFRAKMTFLYLKMVFTKVPILHHFNLKSHIWNETDASGYAISRILSQLTLDQNFFSYVIGKNLNFFKSS